jgi:hypothetical protein
MTLAYDSGGWLDWCVWLPGPVQKTGYGDTHSRTAEEVEGEVKHSMEGYHVGAISRLMTPYNPDDRYTWASWHFSIPKYGFPWQHYPIFGPHSICWHCGLPGDRRRDTSLVGNLTLVGIEHEDAPDDLLNDNQVYWTARISAAIRRLCPHAGARPPALRVNLWEHRWLAPTECPSGLIPWREVIQLLGPQEDDMLYAIIRDDGQSRGVYATNGVHKWLIPSAGVRQELEGHGLIRPDPIRLSPTTFDLIPVATGSVGSKE